MKNSAPAVLLGLPCTSLPVARSLGRKGIEVFGIDQDPNAIGAKSRYVKFLGVAAGDEDLLKTLLGFAQRRGSKGVLFPFSDEHLIFLSRNKERLSGSFLFPTPNERPLERLVSKDSMNAIFTALGISIPKSVVLKKDATHELDDFKLAFPVVIKPNLHAKWINDPEVVKGIGFRKTLLIDDLPSLKKYIGLLNKYDTILAQEFVPGKSENLYYYVGYRNRDGQMLASFVGRKLRTFPDLFGSECFLQSVHNPDLCKQAEEILGKLNYVGPAGLDFKFDARDQRFKLIEINCRFGISDGLPVACGVDLPYIYYQDAQGMNPPAKLDYKENVYWCWFEKEMEWFRAYRSRDGFTKLKWCAHFLLNRYSYALFAKDDVKPFMHTTAGLIRRALGRIK